jgi:hypothetical protein
LQHHTITQYGQQRRETHACKKAMHAPQHVLVHGPIWLR